MANAASAPPVPLAYPVAVTWMRKRDHNVFANAASLLICGAAGGRGGRRRGLPRGRDVRPGRQGRRRDVRQLPTELTVDAARHRSATCYASDGKTLLATITTRTGATSRSTRSPQSCSTRSSPPRTSDFYKHNGVDLKGIARAFVQQPVAAPDSPQGASTLTMQYVRLAITYSATHPADVVAATEDTTARKLREMQATPSQLEKKLSKDEILSRYLNLASFGNGAYGVFAASQVYFGKAPKDLSSHEAALLAGLVKAPDHLRPDHPQRLPAGARPAQLRHRQDGQDRRDHPAGGGRGQGRSSWRSTASAPRTAASPPTHQRLGLLLRLLLPLVAASRRPSAPPRTTGSGGSRAAATRSSPRWTCRRRTAADRSTSSKSLDRSTARTP